MSELFSRTDAGVSPVVGAILMVAVVVLLSAAVGTFVLQIGGTTKDNPRASVTVDQSIKGNGGDYAALVQVHSMDNADYIVLKTNTTPDANEMGMELVKENGIMYRWNEGTIEWSEFESDGKNIHRMDAPPNSGTVSVTLDYQAESYESSGTILYARDSAGNLIRFTNSTGATVWCDSNGGGGNPPTSYSEHSSLSCPNQGSYRWNATYTASTSNGSIEAVYLASDIENVHEEFWDRAQLHYLHVTNSSGGKNVACTECLGQFKSSESGTDYSNDTIYYASNDAAEVGSTIAIRHLKPDTEVTVMAVKDGKKVVLQTYTVREQK